MIHDSSPGREFLTRSKTMLQSTSNPRCTGSGKTQLIQSLLHSGGVSPSIPASPARSPLSATAPPIPSTSRCPLVDPFEGATKRVEVVEGTVHGMRIVCIDTPGIVASAEATAYNGKVLQQIRR